METENSGRTAAKWTALLLFVAVILFILTKPIAQDEGVFLTIGKYLNTGLLPYKDFFDHKPPGIYFLFALVFKLFGASLLVAQLTLCLSLLTSSFLVFRISEKLKRDTGWLSVCFFLFLLMVFEGTFLIAEPFLLLPLLFSLFVLVTRQRARLWIVLAGMSLAVAALLKQTAIVSVLPLFMLAWKTLTKKGFAWLVAGFFTPILLVLAYLSMHHLVRIAFEDIVTLTVTKYPREPFFSVLWSLGVSFLVTAPLWILFLAGLKRKFEHSTTLLLLAFLPVPFFFFRHYPHYWVQIVPFVSIVAAMVASSFRTKKFVSALILFCVLIAGIKVFSDVPRHFAMLRAQIATANELNGQPFARVLAENQFTGMYFLLNRPPLNRYLYITEIDNDALAAEATTIDDLRSAEDVLVLWPHDPNYAYARRLQALLRSTFTLQQHDDVLDLDVLRRSELFHDDAGI